MKRRGNYPKRRPPLGEIHYAAIELLAYKRGMNYEEIADKLGISVRTLYRYRQRKDFERELTAAVERRLRAIRVKPTLSDLLSDTKYLTEVIGIVGLMA